MPRTCVRELPFSIGKGSTAALKGAMREQERARGSNTGARESTQGHACLGAFYQAGRSKWEPILAAKLTPSPPQNITLSCILNTYLHSYKQ